MILAIGTVCLAALALGSPGCDPPTRPIPEIPPPMTAKDDGHVYLDEAGVRELVIKYFPEDVDVDLAVKVARCESSFKTTAVNKNPGSRDWGLWQINDYYWGAWLKEGDWRDPVFNTKVAARIYKVAEKATGNGWNYWVCYANEMI